LTVSTINGNWEITIDPSEPIRSQGITSNPNYFGYVLLLATAALLYFWGMAASTKTRGIVMAIFVPIALGIIASGSRKAFVGLVMLVMLWFWMCYGKEILKKPSSVILLLLILGTVFFLTNYTLNKTFMGVRFKRDLVERQDRLNENIRVRLYQEGLEIIRKNPVFGIGLGNFQVMSSFETESHSDYIEVAASTGIIGFLLYFSIYVVLWRRLGRIQKSISNPSVAYNIKLLKAAILTILIVGWVRPNFTSQITWVFLASAIGYACSLDGKSDNARCT
jgi:O-antigen ligase